MLSQGNPRLVTYVYSLSLLGFSLGSLAVMLGYTLDPTMVLAYSLAVGLAYQHIQRGVRPASLNLDPTTLGLLEV